MKIKFESTTPFKDIKMGDTFLYHSAVYMKTDLITEGLSKYNAICLSDEFAGYFMFISDTEEVRTLKGYFQEVTN